MAVVYESKYKGKTKLGLAIETTIRQLKDRKTYANITKDTPCVELTKLISGMTGGNVRIKIGAFNYVNAYALIPMLDNNNPLITKSMTNASSGLDKDLQYIKFKKKFPDLVGGYDFDKNEFHGWTKEVDFDLCIGYRCIYPALSDKDMTPEVATFILLHEFGHLIEKIYGVGSLMQENYILSQAHHRMMGNSDSKKRITVLRDILEEEGIGKDGDVESVIDDDVAMYTVLIGKLRGEVRSELGSYGYDQTGSESLADYFATKQGYGIGALYLAVPNTMVLQPDDIHYLVSWALNGALVGLLTASSSGMIITVLAGLAYSALTGYSYDTNAMRYDNTADRLERVLNGYVESIRSNKAKVSNQELIEVKRIINTLETLPKDQDGILQRIFEYVNPRGRTERNARLLQKNLESLNNHKLNVKALEYLR